MGFGDTRLKKPWDASTPRRARPIPASFWDFLPSPENITELGASSPDFAIGMLEKWPNAMYRSFDVSPAATELLLAALSPFPGRAFAGPINSSCELPLPDASQDLFACCEPLELMRMDQLYMALSEARRVLRPGGHCLLASDAKVSGLQGLLQRWSGVRTLELTHYISPEDWETLRDERALGRQFLLLRRLAG